MKNKVLSLLLALFVCVSGVACAATYTADGQGMIGAVTVTVDYADGKINAVTVDAHNETAGISDPAIARIPAEIVEKQSIAVDTVAGATMTSKAILSAVEAALTAAGADVESFKVAAEASKIVEGATEKTDVVIVGAGLAGLMAAYELKDNYPDVDYILIDKLDVVTGSLPTTGGAIVATTSKLHSADNAECTTQDIVDLFTYTSGTSIDETLVHNVYAESNVVLDRLVGWNCNFITPQVSSTYSDKVISYWHDGRGAGLVAAMNPYMDANPVNLRKATKAENLLVEDGKVIGVRVSDAEKTYDILAQYVVLATGGFGSNPKYMEQYLPLFADGFFSTNAGATGDGITMTARFGTKVIGDGSMGTIVAPDGSALIAVNFLVNNAGERFIGETEPKYVLQRAVSQQDNKEAFLIADASYADKETIAKKIELGFVKEYNTLEELANDNGIDAAGLLKTVEAYNAAADKGEDIPAKEYALAASAAHKVVTAPYYVEKVTLRTFGTIPGIEVNEFCQVVDGEGNPVSGLYGVGELIAGNAFTRQYPGAGIGISWAANTGRYVAAELAEKVVPGALDNVYTGKAFGMKSDITVKVTMDGEKIADVKVIDHDDTDVISDAAIASVPARIVEKQNIEVDAVAGATMTSNGIKNAVAKALESAGANLADYRKGSDAVAKTEKEAESFDIVVVGGGISGMSAAIEVARANNASVVLVEKEGYAGGSSLLCGGGIWALDTELNEKIGVNSSAEELIAFLKSRSGDAELNEPLLKNIHAVVPEVFNYIAANGLPYKSEGWSLGHPQSQLPVFWSQNPTQGESKYFDSIEKMARDLGVEIRLNSKATELVTENGAVTGVVIEDLTNTYTINAKKVILATGGFTRNAEMIAKYAPEFANAFPFTGAGSTGDGITMTADLGAQVIGTGMMGLTGLNANYGYYGPVGSVVRVPSIAVSLEGENINMGSYFYADTLELLLSQTGSCAYGISDATHARVNDLESAHALGLAGKFDTVEALAAQYGIDAAKLTETVAAANLTQAPYYCMIVKPLFIGSIPGLKVDADCRVLGADDQPIQNLLASGELIFGNVFAERYSASGTGIGISTYSGALAAKTALAEIAK